MDIAILEEHRRHAVTASGPISYLDVGEGSSVAVLVHGILTNSLLWRHVISALASDGRRVIAVDLPGHGRTPPASESDDVSLTSLARRVGELCDHLGLSRFDLVANDTGGAVAQIVGAQLSDRLATLTLTNCDTEGNTPPTLFKPVAALARTDLLATVGPRIAARRPLVRALLLAGYPNVRRIPPEVVDAYGSPVLGTPGSARAFARLIAALSSEDLAAVRPQLANLTVPTLVVWGTGDVFFPTKWGRRLAELIPGTTDFRTIKGARMHFPDYRAAEFIPLLRRHLNSHD
jgi:pimeloyl-ACP methyl ester carboxylesterase